MSRHGNQQTDIDELKARIEACPAIGARFGATLIQVLIESYTFT